MVGTEKYVATLLTNLSNQTDKVDTQWMETMLDKLTKVSNGYSKNCEGQHLCGIWPAALL